MDKTEELKDSENVIGILPTKKTKAAGRTRYAASLLPKYILFFDHFKEMIGKDHYDINDVKFMKARVSLLEKEHPAMFRYYTSLEYEDWVKLISTLQDARETDFKI